MGRKGLEKKEEKEKRRSRKIRGKVENMGR